MTGTGTLVAAGVAVGAAVGAAATGTSVVSVRPRSWAVPVYVAVTEFDPIGSTALHVALPSAATVTLAQSTVAPFVNVSVPPAAATGSWEVRVTVWPTIGAAGDAVIQ